MYKVCFWSASACCDHPPFTRAVRSCWFILYVCVCEGGGGGGGMK